MADGYHNNNDTHASHVPNSDITSSAGYLPAIRDEPVLVVLAGGLSLVPTGVFLLFMPGFARWIGILNLGLVVTGVILLRSAGEGGGDAPVSEWNTMP